LGVQAERPKLEKPMDRAESTLHRNNFEKFRGPF
jgi:hypothetical protein